MHLVVGSVLGFGWVVKLRDVKQGEWKWTQSMICYDSVIQKGIQILPNLGKWT